MGAEAIARALRGQKTPSGWIARCPTHDDHAPSLLLSDGDDGKLLVYCYAGCEGAAVIDQLRRLGLLEDCDHDWRQYRPPVRHRPQPQPRDDGATVQALSIWRASKKPEGSPVEHYLRSRGYTGEIPPTLRYAICLRHNPSGHVLPAMVAAVTTWPESRVVAIHRTYLTIGGEKAPLTPAKMMLGPVRGGAVRLAPAGRTLALAEGIETGLSVQLATGIPTWAALSAGGLETVRLPDPPLAMDVLIAADNDPSGRGIQAAATAAQRFAAESRGVRVAVPPEMGQDFNDLLRGTHGRG